MRKYDHVFFDLDGTLTDPGEGITNSVAYALRKFGITPPPREELYKFIGPPLDDSFMEYYSFTPENAWKGVLYYREYFDEKGIFENKVLPGAHEFLSKLKEGGYALILATSKPEPAALKILERFELLKYFDCVCGADLAGKTVRKDAVLKLALKRSRADPARSVMVGDRMHDVSGSLANGFPCIGVTFGYGSREELISAGAEMLAGSFAEVYDFIVSSE